MRRRESWDRREPEGINADMELVLERPILVVVGVPVQ